MDLSTCYALHALHTVDLYVLPKTVANQRAWRGYASSRTNASYSCWWCFIYYVSRGPLYILPQQVHRQALPCAEGGRIHWLRALILQNTQMPRLLRSPMLQAWYHKNARIAKEAISSDPWKATNGHDTLLTSLTFPFGKRSRGGVFDADLFSRDKGGHPLRTPPRWAAPALQANPTT